MDEELYFYVRGILFAMEGYIYFCLWEGACLWRVYYYEGMYFCVVGIIFAMEGYTFI